MIYINNTYTSFFQTNRKIIKFDLVKYIIFKTQQNIFCVDLFQLSLFLKNSS